MPTDKVGQAAGFIFRIQPEIGAFTVRKIIGIFATEGGGNRAGDPYLFIGNKLAAGDFNDALDIHDFADRGRGGLAGQRLRREGAQHEQNGKPCQK